MPLERDAEAKSPAFGRRSVELEGYASLVPSPDARGPARRGAVRRIQHLGRQSEDVVMGFGGSVGHHQRHRVGGGRYVESAEGDCDVSAMRGIRSENDLTLEGIAGQPAPRIEVGALDVTSVS